MINGKQLLIEKKIVSGRSISLQLTSNTVIYERSISSIVNKNNI